jgi:hypothetical protein
MGAQKSALKRERREKERRAERVLEENIHVEQQRIAADFVSNCFSFGPGECTYGFFVHPILFDYMAKRLGPQAASDRLTSYGYSACSAYLNQYVKPLLESAGCTFVENFDYDYEFDRVKNAQRYGFRYTSKPCFMFYDRHRVMIIGASVHPYYSRRCPSNGTNDGE